MDIKNKIRDLFPSMKKGIERFPVTVLFGILAFIFAIIGNEIDRSNYDKYVEYILWAKLFLIGIPFSATSELIREKYFSDKNRGLFRLGYFIFISLFLFGFKWWMKNVQANETINIISMIVIFYMSFLLLPIIDRKNDKEKYLQTVVGNQLLTIAFSWVMYMGITSIILAVDSLIIKLNVNLYLYSFFFSSLIFGVIFFVSRLKKIDENLEDYETPKMTQILYSYIIIPLIFIYTSVLYIYSAKILVLWRIPKGMVSNLVLWYMVFSLFIMIMISPLTEKNKITEKFRKIFPLISLPLICLTFFSIFERIFQYGITENRYIIVALSIWLFFNMIMYIIKPDVRKVLVSLIIIIAVTVFSPWNMTSLSISSQTKRMEKLLADNGFLKDKKLIKSTEANAKAKKEIMSLTYYFFDSYNSARGNRKLKIRGKEYSSIDDFMKEIGADYTWNAYDSQSTYNSQKEIVRKGMLSEVKGYDYFIGPRDFFAPNAETTINTEKVDIKLTKNGELIIISKEKNNELVNIPLKSKAEEILSNLKNEIPDDLNNIEFPSEKLSFTGENEKIKYKIEFYSIYVKEKINVESYQISISFSEK